MSELKERIEKLKKLREAATEGPYYVAEDAANDATHHKNSGLALIDTGRESDWPVARLCEWPTANYIAELANDAIPLLEACQSEIERLERENERLQRWKKLLEDAPGESKDSIRTRCLETDYIQPIVGEWRKKVERLERQLELGRTALIMVTSTHNRPGECYCPSSRNIEDFGHTNGCKTARDYFAQSQGGSVK